MKCRYCKIREGVGWVKCKVVCLVFCCLCQGVAEQEAEEIRE